MQAEAKSAEERSQQLSAEAEQLRRKLAVGEEQWQARLKKEAALAAQLKQQVGGKSTLGTDAAPEQNTGSCVSYNPSAVLGILATI